MNKMFCEVPHMAKYKRGLIIGDFDMFNVRHLDFIKQAKEWCDYLIVGVYTDECNINEEEHRAIIPFADRTRIVKSVRYVDEVIPIDKIHLESVWEAHSFDVFFDIKLEEEKQFFRDKTGLFGKKQVSFVTLKEGTMPLDTLTEHLEIQDRGVVGYTTGVYDMFHIGHLNILERAKSQCDFLIVGVSTDENVVSYKHKCPVISFEERAAIIRSIRFVDAVVAQKTMDKYAAWENLHFNVIFHGDDWKGSSMYNEVEMRLNSVGCETRFLPHTNGISTSILREKLDMK